MNFLYSYHLYDLGMFLSLLGIGKGMYDIYWTGQKAHLKKTFIVQYLLPLLCALLLLPYVYRII